MKSAAYFKVGNTEIKAVDGASFQIDKGSFTVVVGPSGAGKTTILNLLGGMDKADEGRIFVDNQNVSTYNETETLSHLSTATTWLCLSVTTRSTTSTALENVELATQICQNALDPIEILKEVGLEDRLANFPSQLSGGEQQRVAIARALAKNPKLLLCDEPTGALDSKTGQQILALLQDASKKYNMTVVLITHNSSIAMMADQVISVRNGSIAQVSYNDEPLSASEIKW